MVCGRCGQPLGGTVIPLRRGSRRQGPGRWSWRAGGWLWLGLLLGLSGVLAALDTPRSPWRPPPGRPWGDGPTRSTSLRSLPAASAPVLSG